MKSSPLISRSTDAREIGTAEIEMEHEMTIRKLIRRLALSVVTAITVTSLLTLLPVNAGEQQGTSLLIRNVNIIDIDSGNILPNRNVLVQNGYIKTISESKKKDARQQAAETDVIDGSGKYLIPGLIDAHAHMLTEALMQELIKSGDIKPTDPNFSISPKHSYDSRVLFQFLNSGVTTILTMGSVVEGDGDLTELRNAISAGEFIGPRMIVGKVLNGSRDVMTGRIEPSKEPSSIDNPQTAEHGREGVLRAKQEGYDFIKAYQFLNRETYTSILTTAHQNGLVVIGHLPELGCPTCMTREEAFGLPLHGIAHMEELSRFAMVTDFSINDLSYLTALVKQANTYVIPTLITKKTIVDMYVNRKLSLPDPEYRPYIDSLSALNWSKTNNKYLTEEFRAQAEAPLFPAAYDYDRVLTRQLWKAGVPLVVGTDVVIPGITHGFSVHDEMIELNKIGLSPIEVLRAASVNALKMVKKADDAGTIKEGKRADLVLLSANPLEYMGNIRKIAGVVVAGKWLSADYMRSVMEDNATYYKAMDAALGIQRETN